MKLPQNILLVLKNLQNDLINSTERKLYSKLTDNEIQKCYWTLKKFKIINYELKQNGEDGDVKFNIRLTDLGKVIYKNNLLHS